TRSRSGRWRAVPLLLREKSEARQTPLTGLRMDDGQPALRLLELSCSFELDQLLPAPGTGLRPPFGKEGAIVCHIPCMHQRQARFLNQSVILTGWGKEHVPNGTAGGDLLIGEDASDDGRVSEEQAAPFPQDTRPLLEHLQATGHMIHGVNADDGRKRVILKGEALTGIPVLKVNQRVQSQRVRPRVGGSRTARVDV